MTIESLALLVSFMQTLRVATVLAQYDTYMILIAHALLMLPTDPVPQYMCVCNIVHLNMYLVLPYIIDCILL